MIDDRFSQQPRNPANSPKVFDRQLCGRIIKFLPNYSRLPNFEYLKMAIDQLEIILREMDAAQAKIDAANGDAIRFQKEATVANAEVKAMQELVAKARDERDTIAKELAALKEAPPPVPAAAPKAKRGRPAKVVPMTTQQKAAQ